MVPAGRITGWGYFIYDTTTKTGEFVNFRIKLCPTRLTSLGSKYTDNYDGNTPTEVFRRETFKVEPVVNKWYDIEFDTPFNYDSRQNLLIEVWWKVGTAVKAYTHRNTRARRFVYSYIKNGTAYFGFPLTGVVADYQHYMRITMSPSGVAPTSLGRLRALYW